MNNTWNDMTLGERIITSAWIATREHLLAEHAERLRVVAGLSRFGLPRATDRWSASPFDSGDEEETPDGYVREGAD